MEKGSTGVVMQPVERRGHWRVKMTWPRRAPRLFGKFDSEAEAQRWIAEHSWLAKRQVDPAETTDPPREAEENWRRP